MSGKKVAVVLLNLGGPDSPDAIQPFIYNLFMDENIIKLPFKDGIFRHWLANFISRARLKKLKKKYSLIGGHSPINHLTELQRSALEKKLNESGVGSEIAFKVFTAMRYSPPFTNEVIKEIESEKGAFQEIILLPLYPQYSFTTTQSSFLEWKKVAAESNSLRYIKTHFIKDYCEHPKLIEAFNLKIEEWLKKFPNDARSDVHLLFSAHGTPMSEFEAGDPYSEQVQQTVQAIMQRRGYDLNYWLAYQSRVGPMKWLKPYTEDVIKNIRKNGGEYLLVIPVSFVTDHIETLVEIGMEYKEEAMKLGYKQFEFTSGLNDHPLFIETLADCVIEKINMSKKVLV